MKGYKMKTSTKPLQKSSSIISKLMMALVISSALGSVAPAFADPYDHDRHDDRRDWHDDHRDWHDDHRDWHHGRHWDRDDHDHYYATPVYVPPPVYYAPPEPYGGISIVLPIHIR
jgi:Ni/Co efflux regulator RcnB